MEPEQEQPTHEDSTQNNDEVVDATAEAETPEPPVEPAAPAQESPADALSRTPEDLIDEQVAAIDPAETTSTDSKQPKVKRPSRIKAFFKRANVYFLIFILVVIVAAAVTVVYYLNSQKPPAVPEVATQELTEEALKQLANKDASVGSSAQTLTIQGNAIIDGQTLMRGNLNVAGNFQSGGSIQGPSLTISGSANIGDAQINSLQVASNTAIQGNTTLRDLNVAGTSTFSGALTASQITVTRLILSGNASLEVPNHIGFTGPTPGRSINAGPLGSGGSASVSGSDTAGTVNVSTGNNPQAGCFVRINFNQRFSNMPHVIISPIGSGAGRTQYYVERDQAGFSICAASPAPGNQTFAYDYFVTN